MRPALPSLLALILAMSSTGCGGGFVAAGPTLDAGTLGVTGLESGVGGHSEAGTLWEREDYSLGVAVTGALAGYQGEGDGDPLFFTSAEARYRRALGQPRASSRPFVEAGCGPVLAWMAGPRQGGLSLHCAVGIEGGGESLRWWIALRERPTGLFGRQAEFFNSAQVVFGLTMPRSR